MKNNRIDTSRWRQQWRLRYLPIKAYKVETDHIDLFAWEPFIKKWMAAGTGLCLDINIFPQNVSFRGFMYTCGKIRLRLIATCPPLSISDKQWPFVNRISIYFAVRKFRAYFLSSNRSSWFIVVCFRRRSNMIVFWTLPSKNGRFYVKQNNTEDRFERDAFGAMWRKRSNGHRNQTAGLRGPVVVENGHRRDDGKVALEDENDLDLDQSAIGEIQIWNGVLIWI